MLISVFPTYKMAAQGKENHWRKSGKERGILKDQI